MVNDLSNLEILLNRIPELTSCKEEILAAYDLLADCFDRGGCIFTCGNGGSAADAEHMVGELLKGFTRKRRLCQEDRQRMLQAAKEEAAFLAEHLQYGLRAVSLMSPLSINSAAANDQGGELGAAQQLFALGQPGDVLVAFSTSGNAKNVACAAQVARYHNMKVLGLSGRGGGRLSSLADVCIHAPADETYRIQEFHLPVYHCLCIMIEARYFTE